MRLAAILPGVRNALERPAAAHLHRLPPTPNPGRREVRPPLSSEQMRYAATDAWASLRCHEVGAWAAPCLARGLGCCSQRGKGGLHRLLVQRLKATRALASGPACPRLTSLCPLHSPGCRFSPSCLCWRQRLHQAPQPARHQVGRRSWQQPRPQLRRRARLRRLTGCPPARSCATCSPPSWRCTRRCSSRAWAWRRWRLSGASRRTACRWGWGEAGPGRDGREMSTGRGSAAAGGWDDILELPTRVYECYHCA